MWVERAADFVPWPRINRGFLKSVLKIIKITGGMTIVDTIIFFLFGNNFNNIATEAPVITIVYHRDNPDWSIKERITIAMV